MTQKDGARFTETAEVIELPDYGPNFPTPEGARLDPHPDKPAKLPATPKGKSGTWEEAQIADDPDAHYAHEQVWVEHHGLDNGRYMAGRLLKFVEDAR